MNVLLAIVLFLFALSILFLIHEIGHAVAAKWIGRPVTEFGFGLPPSGPALRFQPRGKGPTTYSIHPIPIGAFVRYDFEVGELGYHDNAVVSGGGPFASLMAGWFLQAVAYAVALVDTPGLTFEYLLGVRSFTTPLGLFTVSLLFLALFRVSPRWTKVVFSFLMPVASFAVAAWLGSHLTESVSIIGAAHLSTKVSFASLAIYLAGVLSVGIGYAMLLPLYPLDGATLFCPLIVKHCPRLLEPFMRYGIMLLGLISIYLIQKDLAPIVLPLFLR